LFCTYLLVGSLRCADASACPAPVILSASTGSFASIAARTTQRPSDTIAQRLLRNDDSLRGNLRLVVRVEILGAHVRLVVEPDLGDEHGDQTEDDGKPDHDYGTGAHDKPRWT
jgi:hypothetical protein